MIETKNLTKKFDSFTAVDSLDLRIETGEFFGLLGPNGAGKTTTISLLSTLLLPTEGEILIDGQTLGRNRPDLKRKISVITQEYSMRQDMNMDEIMEYQGRLYFMPRKEIKRKTEELLDFCGLLPFRKRTVRKLSGGMKPKAYGMPGTSHKSGDPSSGRAHCRHGRAIQTTDVESSPSAERKKSDHSSDNPLYGRGTVSLQPGSTYGSRKAGGDQYSIGPDRRPGQIHRRSGNTGRGKKPLLPQSGRGHLFSVLSGRTVHPSRDNSGGCFCGARRQASDAAISRRQPQLFYNLTEWTMNYHGNTYYFMGKMGGVPKGFL